MGKGEEAARLARIRARLGRLDGTQFALAADGAEMVVTARGGFGDPAGALVTVARFTGYASTEEMQALADGLADLAFVMGLLDRAIARVRDLSASRGASSLRDGPSGGAADDGRASVEASPAAAEGGRRERNHAAEAAMLCGNGAFKAFLLERKGLERPATDERTAQHLRGLLGVTSRREINQDDTVRARWVQLRREFYGWKKMGVPA